MPKEQSVKCMYLNSRRCFQKEVVRGVAVKRQTSEKSKPNDIGIAVNKLRKHKKELSYQCCVIPDAVVFKKHHMQVN